MPAGRHSAGAPGCDSDAEPRPPARRCRFRMGKGGKSWGERFKPLEELRKTGFVLPKITTIDCCLALFYPRYRGPLGLAAQQSGARIAPTYAGLVAPVGRLQVHIHAPAVSPAAQHVSAPMDLAHPAGAESLAPQPSQLASARNSPLSVSRWVRRKSLGERFKPLDELRKIGFVLPRITTIDCFLA